MTPSGAPDTQPDALTVLDLRLSCGVPRIGSCPGGPAFTTASRRGRPPIAITGRAVLFSPVVIRIRMDEG